MNNKKSKELQEYFQKDVKKAADFIYGSVLSDRAWRKWKRLLYIPRGSKTVDYDEAVCLLTFAYLRKAHPRTNYKKPDIKKYILSSPYTPESLKEKLDEAFKAKVLGKDLPVVIRQVTGRTVTLRTIYRWSKVYEMDFSASKVIPHQEVERWINLVS